MPWTQIARMRDRVAHRYFDVDYGAVWDTLTADLADLEKAVRGFLHQQGG
ncbi:MAG: HepT-like ribonuclease domain-containing protein [Acidimicrobiia bacterium]